jgi:glycosyltransferase involved in cell wall biosynthesis
MKLGNSLPSSSLPVNDEIKLSEAIIKLIKNKELREEMGNEGYKRFINNFTLEAMIEQTENIYLNLI